VTGQGHVVVHLSTVGDGSADISIRCEGAPPFPSYGHTDGWGDTFNDGFTACVAGPPNTTPGCGAALAGDAVQDGYTGPAHPFATGLTPTIHTCGGATDKDSANQSNYFIITDKIAAQDGTLTSYSVLWLFNGPDAGKTLRYVASAQVDEGFPQANPLPPAAGPPPPERAGRRSHRSSNLD
jgi:hypothetical protein